MNLKDILQNLADTNDPVLLCDQDQEWEAKVLLEKLSEHKLKTHAHVQPGLYIAEINDGGYLGQVLYRIKHKPD
jgi:hypothetical protein